MKYFYSEHIKIESVYIALEELDIKHHEKKELIKLVESQVHHVILNLVLSQLTSADKKKFLFHHSRGKHDEVWKLLHEKVDNIEVRIENAVEELKSKLHVDINVVKKK